MRFAIRPMIALLLAATAANVANAQAARGTYTRAPTSTGGQRGVQPAPTPETARVVRRDHSGPSRQTTMPTPVKVVLIPAVLMSDGSVFADFGAGMEPVRRACAGVKVSTGGRVIGGNGQVLSQPAPHLQPVPQMQPVPRLQPAPGMQSSTLRQLSKAAAASCFTRDVNGKVFATR